jgi:transposase InsO family protein
VAQNALSNSPRPIDEAIAVLRDVTGLQPGGGTKILAESWLETPDSFLTPIRSWLDSGATATLVSSGFIKKYKYTTFKTPRPALLQGVFGTSEELVACKLKLFLVNKKDFIQFPAYVIDSPIMRDCELLIGRDIMGKNKPIALNIPNDDDPIVAIKTKRNIKVSKRLTETKRLKERVKKSHRLRTLNTAEGQVSTANSSENHVSKASLLSPEVQAAVISTANSSEKSVSSSQKDKDSFKNKEIKNGSKKGTESGKWLNLNTLGKPKNLSEPGSASPNSSKTNLNGKLTKFERKKLQKHFNNLLHVTPRYEFPSDKDSNLTEAEDLIGAIVDKWSTIHHVKVTKDKKEKELKQVKEAVAALHTRSVYSNGKMNKKQKEAIALIETLAKKNEDSELKDIEVEWDGLPDSTRTFIHHEFNDQMIKDINWLKSYFIRTMLPAKEKIELGQAKVSAPFDITFKQGAREKLNPKGCKPYPLKGEWRSLMEKVNKEMEDAGVGECNGNSHPAFASPMFFVVNKRKPKPRLCCAFKEINEVTVEEKFPIPRIDDIVESLKGKKYYSLIDLKQGYWQVPLSENAKKYLATISPLGVFHWKVLPFGPKNGPAYFQREMQETLQEGLNKYCMVYIDDIVIYSTSWEEHVQHLRKVFEMLEARNWKVNADKCHLGLKQVKILGRIVTEGAVTPDPDIIKDMVEYPRPRTLKQISAFLGLMNVYRHHLRDHALLSDPLHQVIRAHKFYWGEEQEKAFEILKQSATSAPVLRHPDFSKDFHIHSDASSIGAGAVLLQEHDGMLMPVSFASWLFTPTQRRYSTTEREMLALVLSVRKWKPFFFNRKFLAKTDHKALTGIMNLSDPHGRIARWSAELSQFNFKLEFIPGKDNPIPDAFSRNSEDSALSESVAALIDGDGPADFSKMSPGKILATYGRIQFEELGASLDSFELPNDKEWATAQRQDRKWAPYIKYLEDKTLPKVDKIAKKVLQEIDNYALQGDHKILMRVTQIDPKDNFKTARRVVPAQWRKLICAEYHDSILLGSHMGRDKTYDKVRQHYYFKNMQKYIDLWVTTCPCCQHIKSTHPAHAPQSPLGVIEVDAPWDLFSIDLWGSVTTSTNGNKYILTVIDGYSKFAWALPIPNKKATTIAQALWKNILFRVPMPKRIHSDQGKEFVNFILQKLTGMLGIEKTRTTAYHPQGNAYAERLHRFFKSAISSYVQSDQKNWDEFLEPMMACYNDAHHTALGCTPSEVVFGRKLGLPPFDQKADLSNPGDYPKMDKRKYVQRLRYILAKAQNMIMDKIREKRKRNDRNSFGEKLTAFPQESLVGLWTPQLSSNNRSAKLKHSWNGPFTVVAVSDNGKVYYLKDEFGEELKYPVSILRLRKWFDRTEEMAKYEQRESQFPDLELLQQESIEEDTEPPISSAQTSANHQVDMEVDQSEEAQAPPAAVSPKPQRVRKIIDEPDLEEEHTDNDPDVTLQKRPIRHTRYSRLPRTKVILAQPAQPTRKRRTRLDY